MSSQLDIESLRDSVQSRLGISLAHTSVTVDGGTYPALRPTDLEKDHGFFVAIARTPRQITASVHFDPYAGTLFRRMSEADEASKSAMLALSGSAPALGLSAFCIIEEADPDPSSHVGGRWKSLEIEVSARLPQRNIPQALQRVAENVASFAFSLPLHLVQMEEVVSKGDTEGYPEGAVTQVLVNRYERNPANRAACLAFHGTQCMGCGFDFEARYGPIASGFIEVHHTTPVSKLGAGYIIDPAKDLIPLCSNCHAMVHRISPPLTLEQLHYLIRSHTRDE